MTSKNELLYRELKKTRVVFTLHAWRPTENLAFVTYAQGEQRVLEFFLPPRRGGEKILLPTSLPCEITEIRLAPPYRLIEEAAQKAKEDSLDWFGRSNRLKMADEQWAKENGLDFGEITAERKEVSEWTGADIQDLEDILAGRNLFLDQPFSLQVAGAFQFRVTFADGQKIWLTGCKSRAPQNASEWGEFGLAGRKKRTQAASKAGAFRLALAKHPSEAREIRRHLQQRAKAIGPRGLAQAIGELKTGDWLNKKYPDLAATVKKLSDSTLRNLANRTTGLRLNRNFKS
jgi:hypothetical protein